MIQSSRLLLALLLFPLAADAQKFLPARLPDAARDSFDIVYQGQAVGAFLMSVSRTGETVTLVGEARIPRMRVQEIDSVVFHAASLAPISFANHQTIAGASGSSRVTVVNGKATGTVQRPGPNGVQTIAVDAVIGAGVLADGAEVALLPTLDMSEEATISFQTFDAKTATTKTYEAKVGPRESITVPAGTFDAWKVDLTSDASVTIYISFAEPRKIVLIRLEEAQMEMRRAKD